LTSQRANRVQRVEITKASKQTMTGASGRRSRLPFRCRRRPQARPSGPDDGPL